jgi:3-phosphoshikimate 1-carboxyvinyltransferase
VDALRHLGAKIEYLENEGYPPIKIFGQRLNNDKVALPASVSSQYISALLLIAPELENGLELSLIGEITSISYLKMTLALLNEIGIETSFQANKIVIKPKLKTINPQSVFVESDWSSASYYYSIIALSPVGTKITLATFKQNSLQGDRVLKEIYERMGVVTHFSDNKIQLEKKVDLVAESITLDLINTPDIAQTIAVTCFGLGIECHLSGLHTLKIKETDRLTALKTELTKLGALVSITENSLALAKTSKINSNCVITTYNDHRMAMAFAPLALKTDLIIENADVVSKSYPDFWTDLNRWCFKISEV